MTVWFVSSRNPGADAFIRHGCVAVNFWTRAPIANLAPIDIREFVGTDVGPPLSPGARTRFANQLAAFAGIAPGDVVITFDPKNRETVHVGEVLGPLRYEDPPVIADHPHVLPVKWNGTVQRGELGDGGEAIPSTPGTTVAAVYDELGVAAKPEAPRPTTSVVSARRRRGRPDGFTWDPASGPHRYRLVQTFGREGEPTNPFVVFMVNPGGNDLERIRRSTTCHRVRAWGEEHGYDGASYLNLFSAVTNDVRGLAAIHAENLNGPLADEVIVEVTSRIEGAIVAGWGDPPIARRTYDSRIREVRELVGDRFNSLGVTRSGYPKHGRGWRPDDNLVPLP